jgi:hypothetical protein
MRRDEGGGGRRWVGWEAGARVCGVGEVGSLYTRSGLGWWAGTVKWAVWPNSALSCVLAPPTNILCRAPGVHGAQSLFFTYLYFNLIIGVNVLKLLNGSENLP